MYIHIYTRTHKINLETKWKRTFELSQTKIQTGNLIPLANKTLLSWSEWWICRSIKRSHVSMSVCVCNCYTLGARSWCYLPFGVSMAVRNLTTMSATKKESRMYVTISIFLVIACGKNSAHQRTEKDMGHVTKPLRNDNTLFCLLC